MISVAHNLQSSVFRAPTAKEALAAARASLGDDAVVLSTRTIPSVIGGGGSVEVVARAASAASGLNAALRPSAGAPSTPPRPASAPASAPRPTPAAAAARYRSTTQATPASPFAGHEFVGLGVLGGAEAAGNDFERLAQIAAQPPAAGRGPWKNAADPPWTHKGPRTVGVFVGPTGAGKTTTLVKVAARAVMLHGLRPLLVTFDVWRAGAVAQLESYGRALGLETVVVENPRDMRRVLERDDAEMILVDTAGRSPKDVTALERQATYASALGLHRAHLVLPATFSESAMQSAVSQYSCFPIEDAIVTKIDEAGGHDDIERVGKVARLPVCAATNGQNIVEDLLPVPSSSGYADQHARPFEEDR
jgi:flagellar biosynthesis protein FlhF